MTFDMKKIYLKIKKTIKNWLLPRGFFILKNRLGLGEAIKELLFRKYTGKNARNKRLQKLEKIRQKKRITVLFENNTLSKWKSDTLYEMMQQHPRFNPIIWLRNKPAPISDQLNNKKESLNYFTNKGYSLLDANTCDEMRRLLTPDIIFIQEPYDHDLDLSKNDLLCYLPYVINNTISQEANNNFLQNIALYNFVANELCKIELHEIMDNKGENVIASGLPIIDAFSRKANSSKHKKVDTNTKKKIIYAPHWSINPGASYFDTSTFLNFHEHIIRLVKKYEKSVNFVFKPHPCLYRALCQHPLWGKEKADEYYRTWESLPNAEIITGSYEDLFSESHALIHDCGSFLIEYLIFNKPCMFLKKNAEGYRHYNNLSKEALLCHQIGTVVEDIDNFIQQIIQNKDPLQAKRIEFTNSLISPTASSAQNIISTILGAP